MEHALIDLHIHSTASDGCRTPAELVAMAAERKLAAAALTDHDTVAGLDEFLRAAENSGVTAVPGVEISTTFDHREVHIVGLFIDHHSVQLNVFLNEIRTQRHERNLKIISKLQERGYDISLEEAAALAGGDVVGRPHIARVLFEKYEEFTTLQDVFDKLLKKGRPAYASRSLTTPVEAIRQIHAAHGVAVWAHPIFRQPNEYQWCRKAIKYLKHAQLDALEVYYSSFNSDQTDALRNYAAEFELAMSGGSDYHGATLNEVQMGIGNGGLRVPYEFYETLCSLAEKYR
jgi:hypothetical protein